MRFPLVFIAGALADPKSAFEYLGQETLDARPVHHLKSWTVYSESRLNHLSEFSAKHIWIDSSSGLVVKVSFDRRAAVGSAPRIPVEISFADYRNVGGVLYPFLVRESLNGTPHATIRIENVVLNCGQVRDADFLVR